VAVILVLLFVSPGSQRHPALARSCTTPAIALTASTTGAGHDIGWAITGPDAGTYVVRVDSRTIATVAGLHDCRADGTLPPLATGSHRVQLLRDGQPVAAADLSP
jgi:hypothetical protein